ncbi:hypothetical protein C0991_007377 [Blastosporella zonata]|nr:hypothetical protein C0991_007377 [Blastosporella zonata]
MKILYSKKYGVDLPRFTHRNSAIIHASTKEDDTIRYHSLHDNKYLQYFKGHKEKVISLEVSPVDDGFMSGSMDKTVRLWDLRSPTCRGLLTLPSYPIVAYDIASLVFAVAVNHYSRILLYDPNNYDKAPFLTITLEDPSLSQISYPPRPIYMTSLAFSSNSKFLLVGCSGDAHYILDAYEGHLLAKLEGHVGLERRSLSAPPSIEPAKGSSGEEVSWTPDSKYVIGGSLDGKVLVWDLQSLEPKVGSIDLKLHPKKIKPLVALDGHPGPSRMRISALLTTVAAFVLSVSGGRCSVLRYLVDIPSEPLFFAVVAEETAEAAIAVTAAFSEANPFGRTSIVPLLSFLLLLTYSGADVDVVNGEKNSLLLNVENKSGRNATLVNVAGSVSHPETNRLVKNLTATKIGISLPEGAKLEVPYAFYSEYPGDIRLNVWLEHSVDGQTYRVSAYDSVVTIVEPEMSILDFKLFSTYFVVAVIFGGISYLVYLNLVPQSKRRYKRATPATVSAPVGTVTATGAGGYQEEWIPEHHLKKSKKGGAGLTSGDEVSGSELSGAEGKRRKGRK